MKRRSEWLSQITVLVLLLMVSGCASVKPVPTARAGLFDRLFHKSGHYGGGRGSDEDRGDGSSDVPAEAVQNWSAPLKSMTITSGFGGRGRTYHDGLDLRASTGTPVYAVAPGQVVYAGSKISGYGKMIVLRHDGGLSTVYAHNSKLLVRVGSTVAQSQQIGVSGKTGRVRGPHVHFEVRKGISAIDPEKLAGGEWLSRAPVVASRALAQKNRRGGRRTVRDRSLASLSAPTRKRRVEAASREVD